MSIRSEFKEFAVKGNAIDLAVGVVIGAAFGRIISSLVGDIIMPPLGLAIGRINFTDLAIRIGTDPAGKAVLFRYGAFVQTIFDFLIVAIALFVLLKGINRLKRPSAAVPPVPAATPPLSKSEELLVDIRDILARKP
ncbi:MAG: large-conductance mechanosensitive channel protein MscL [Steroidobacteraceae bacterium]